MKSFASIITAFCFFAQAVLFPALLSAQEQDSFEKEMSVGSDDGGPILDTSSRTDPEPAASNASAFNSSLPGNQSAAPVSAASEAPLYEESEAISPLDRKVGPIRLKGAPLTTFLDVISSQSKVNFIVSDDVGNKTITVFLRKTTVREALEILLRVKGLTYQRIGKSNTYIITKRTAQGPNLITKVYTLNYIPLIPLSSIDKEKGQLMGGNSSTAGNQVQVQQTPSQNEGSQGGSEDDKIAVIKILQSVLSKTYGKVATDPRTNSLIITDIPEVFPQVEQIIAELDKKAPQILIEARIVEISTDRLNELGIEWGGSRGELAYFAGPARLTDYGMRPGFFSGDNWKNFYPPVVEVTGDETSSDSSSSGSGSSSTGSIDPIYSTGKMSPKGVFYGVFSLAQMQAIFRALVSRGEARYLGTPKIVAMNNRPSLIMTTRDAALATQSVLTSAGSTGSSSTTVERRQTGLFLQVTPQVNKEGYVTLVVQPSYADLTASAITMQGSTIYDPIYRGASTMVRVKNGQTVVIGGMLSSTENKTVKKVPLLGYIPVIGWLFTSTSTRKTNTDLVIFITPTILVD
ncbi:MAG: secretin N-terminal domain-containing protein [Elusimicrobiota bacterium]